MKYPSIPCLLLAVAFGSAPASLRAQDQALDKHVIGAGGNTASGGSFTLRSTTGQALAQVSAGNQIVLISGFWVPASTPSPANLMFQDGFEDTTN